MVYGRYDDWNAFFVWQSLDTLADKTLPADWACIIVNTLVSKSTRRALEWLMTIGKTDQQYSIIVSQSFQECRGISESVQKEITVSGVRVLLQIGMDHPPGMPNRSAPEILQYAFVVMFNEIFECLPAQVFFGLRCGFRGDLANA